MKKIKIDLNTKPARYFLARTTGKNKKESALSAGYADGQHITQIENSVEYSKVTEFFKDALLGKIQMNDIASELVKNIVQDIDRGAKNKAIEIALGKLEPDRVMEKEDRVIVVLN